MAHLWVRAEQRDNEQRVGITPDGVSQMLAAGHRVTVENSSCRAMPFSTYQKTGCALADDGEWMDAPDDAIIFGLKELDPNGPVLRHRHIMFGHAYKGQADGPALLQRFRDGGGSLYDLEYLTNDDGRRVAAFGYWAGFAGAAVGIMVWVAQQSGRQGPQSVEVYRDRAALVEHLKQGLDKVFVNGAERPSAIVVGALGRVGSGACDLFEAFNMSVTKWDIDETILAAPGVPVFVPKSALTIERKLTVVADVSCDPSSDYNPIPLYDQASSFYDPMTRVFDGPPPLDVTAIDNLPSMLPLESSEDYAAQLLPSLLALDDMESGVWGRARKIFETHAAR